MMKQKSNQALTQPSRAGQRYIYTSSLSLRERVRVRAFSASYV